MEAVVHIDTNVVIWLYAGFVEQLSTKAQETIENNVITISPLVLLELTYLNEIGRLKETGHVIVNDLYDRIGLTVDTTSLALVIDSAISMKWTRDPFDRMITAQAAVYQNILLSKDQTILDNYNKAVW